MSQQPRILVVDDEPAILLTYTAILEQHGYEVTGVPSVEEAEKALEERAFDLLLCDLTLGSGHSGLEVVEFARERHPRIEAVLLTGFADRKTTSEAAGKRIVLLLKPLEVLHLLQTIGLLMGKNR